MNDWQAAALILLALAIWGAVHSWLASLTVKTLARQTLGQPWMRAYRLAYNIVALLTLLPVLAVPAVLPDQTLYTIPFPWVLLTLAVQAAAVLMLLIGLLQTGLWSFLGLQQLLAPEDEVPARLVVSGLYRWVRHPLYTAGLVIIWLTPVMTRNALILIIGMTVYLIIGAWFEERKLLHEFGSAYQEYRRQTPFLLPRPPRRGV